ncbi:MAG: hypothetical protein DWQ47_00170 [Acidobacteria bacterium]|nr:MAG: hypothetical protein DWQ32_10630 [Acidobacteriota bacterium]REK03927.1 MAG: hypothetical protein DWQ38_00155 [Acidobacteriota bacterium]REK15089.1 MAG: hypothetical protein DWQ43_16320 [Acidobacteriota bacterium]REK46179.1 MAG: hypothetical protein DWQ47_00170 [Acidobacteriota bacterium]
MNNTFVAIGIFLVSVFVARYINEKALRELSEEDAARLLQGFSQYRVYSLVAIILIIAAYFFVNYFYPNSRATSITIFMAAIVVFLLANSVFMFRKLRKLEMPDSYINRFLLVTLIKYGGAFVLFGTVVANQ